MALWFGLAFTAVSWVGFAAYWGTHRLVRSFGSVSESHQALEKLQSIQALMESAESSVCRYVITGDAAGLQAYRDAKGMIPQRLRQVEALASAYPRQRKTLKQLNRLLLIHLQYLSNAVTARQTIGYEAAAQWISAEDNVSPRKALEQALSQLQRMESVAVRQRSSSTSEHSFKAKAALVGSACISLVFLAWGFGLLRREADERLQAEDATERVETFLHSIIERIPYMIQVKEAANLRLTLANKAAAEWFGRSETELLGSNAFDLRPREQALEEMRKDRQALQEGKPVDIPEEPLKMEGREDRILHTQKITVPDRDGNPAYLVTISEDITRRKQSERLIELSRDAAVESARVKAEFLRNMSHEFRTPLSVIIGMTSLLLDAGLTEEQRRFASSVQRAAEGLSRLTKDILDFSKIESGTFTLETQEIPIRHTVEGIATMLSEQAKAKGVALVSLIDNDLPSVVLGDVARLRQILAQLMGNAVKFTARGEVIIRVTEAKQDEAHLWLTCRITDTGIGIDEETQKYLFEAFRQGDGSRTRRFGGTGLGLAMSKRIVELMGGEIGFESAPGRGSTFWCTLPFQKRRAQGPVVEVSSLPWTRARVLVIDENETARQLLRQQLGVWSLASEGVSSGETALALLRREQKAGRPFPIALVDMHLPDMESVALARAVKQDPDLAGAHLILMTDAPLDPATYAPLGFSGCLPKPLQAEALYERLSLLIEPLHPAHHQDAA